MTYSNAILFTSSNSTTSGPCTTTQVCATNQAATGDGNEDVVFSATGTTSQNVDITATGMASYTSVILNVKSGSVEIDNGANHFRGFGVQTVTAPGFLVVGSASPASIDSSRGLIRMTVTSGTEWEIIAVGES